MFLLLLVLLAVFVGSSTQNSDTGGIIFPVIDISVLMDDRNDSYSTEVLHECSMSILNALSTYGTFIAIISHVNDHIHQLSSAKSLFVDIDEVEKKANLLSLSKEIFGRGYIPIGSESGLSHKYEKKEGFSYGYPGIANVSDARNPLESINIWPSITAESREIIESVFIDQFLIVKAIVKALAIVYQDFNDIIVDGERISLMRLFRYFPHQNSDGSNVVGSSEHRDWGFLTVILQDDVGGLQFLHNSKWIDVPTVEHGLVVNAGDYLSLLTNNQIKSPIHRVLCPSITERYSYVYFFYPSYNAPLQSLVVDTKHQEAVRATVSEAIDSFNTLLVLNDGSATANIANDDVYVFGDYVMKKWTEVFRK